ncbi:hypothetical protein CLOP_g2540, partial [Closterium sp. NIES-67]
LGHVILFHRHTSPLKAHLLGVLLRTGSGLSAAPTAEGVGGRGNLGWEVVGVGKGEALVWHGMSDMVVCYAMVVCHSVLCHGGVP